MTGPSAGSLHAGNVALHALAAGLLALLLVRRTGSLLAGGAAATFWALHPLNTEVVAWIACRHDLLVVVAATGVLLANDRRSWAAASAQGGLLLLALLSKESAIVIPAVCIVDDVASRRPLREAWRGYLAQGLAVLAWVVLRSSARLAPTELPPAALALENVIYAVAQQLARAALPWPLTVDRPWAPPTLAQVTTGAIAVAALVWLAWRFRAAAAGVALFLLSIAPVTLAAMGYGYSAERYSYLPLVGLAWVLAVLSAAAARTFNRARWLAPGAVAAAALAGAVLTSVRLPDWQSDRALFGAALREDPGSWFAREQLGLDALREQRWQEGVRWLRDAQARHPASGQVANGLALANLQLGDVTAALEQARLAVALSPQFPQARVFLAWALHLSGDHGSEAAQLEACLALAPGNARARVALGEARSEIGDPRGEADLEAIGREASDAGAAASAALVRQALLRGDRSLAERRLAELRTLHPASPEVPVLERAMAEAR